MGFELFTVPGQLGWQYDHAEPRDFARSAAETGVSPDWHVLGIEYAPAARLIVVPLWAAAAVTAGLATLGFRRLRRRGKSRSRSPITSA
jgi:hypothetical protein